MKNNKPKNNDGMSFDANAGAVGNRPIFMGAFVDALHEATFGFNFQRLAAGVIANCSRRVVRKWSTEKNRTFRQFGKCCANCLFLVR